MGWLVLFFWVGVDVEEMRNKMELFLGRDMTKLSNGRGRRKHTQFAMLISAQPGQVEGLVVNWLSRFMCKRSCSFHFTETSK